LPPLRDSSDTSSYPKLLLDTARSSLILRECRGITEGGYRVEITEDLHRRQQIPLQFPKVQIQQQESFSVYVSIDMFESKGAGKMSAAFYELSVIYKSDEMGLSGFNHLKIAEYVYSKGNFIRDQLFIPPCMTINAHPTLMKRFETAGASLNVIHVNGIKLTQTYRTDTRPNVKEATAWIEKIASFLATSIWTYNDVLVRQSPLYTITFFKNLAQYVLSMIKIYKGNRYIRADADSQRPIFEALAEPDFDGEDLKMAFDKIDIALNALHEWFKYLGESFKEKRNPRVEDQNQ